MGLLFGRHSALISIAFPYPLFILHSHELISSLSENEFAFIIVAFLLSYLLLQCKVRGERAGPQTLIMCGNLYRIDQQTAVVAL